VTLIEPSSYYYNPQNRAFDISPDGERFLMLRPLADDRYAGLTRLIVVQNWFEELEARVPVE
jgi:hypothetical protein